MDHLLAKQGNLFTDGKLIKCLVAAAREICPEKINLLKPSSGTVLQRAEDIVSNINSQVKNKVDDFK